MYTNIYKMLSNVDIEKLSTGSFEIIIIIKLVQSSWKQRKAIFTIHPIPQNAYFVHSPKVVGVEEEKTSSHCRNQVRTENTVVKQHPPAYWMDPVEPLQPMPARKTNDDDDDTFVYAIV